MHPRITLLFALPTLGLARPQPGSVLDLVGDLLNPISTEPPDFLKTIIHSPQCAATNNGTLMCCDGLINGDLPIVKSLADLVGYHLDPNSINGLSCSYKPDAVCTSPNFNLCCEVTALSGIPIVQLALWCHDP
ncbi:hypothetical protein B7494_g8524 [Chlorociboria aeruginascens]|nr:hypothetical protein B7494_g8524 [Chlorociboria aeruginascens]